MGDYGSIGLIGGLAQGISQGMMYRQQMTLQQAQEARIAEYMNTQKKLLNVQLDLEQKKAGILGGMNPDMQAIAMFGLDPLKMMQAETLGQLLGGPGGPQGPAGGAGPEEAAPQGTLPEQIAAGQTGIDRAGLERFAMTGDPRMMYERYVQRDLGDKVIEVGEYSGQIRNVYPKSVKPEFFNVKTPGGGTIKIPYNPFNPPPGIQTQPSGLTPEQTGKTNLAINAKRRLDEIEALLFPGGELNRGIVLKMKAPGGPFGEAATLYSKMYQVTDALLRFETGAAQTPQEIQTKMEEFWPRAIDTDKAIREKWEDFKEYAAGGIKLIDPTGKIAGGIEKQEAGTKLQDPLGIR